MSTIEMLAVLGLMAAIASIAAVLWVTTLDRSEVSLAVAELDEFWSDVAGAATSQQTLPGQQVARLLNATNLQSQWTYLTDPDSGNLWLVDPDLADDPDLDAEVASASLCAALVLPATADVARAPSGPCGDILARTAARTRPAGLLPPAGSQVDKIELEAGWQQDAIGELEGAAGGDRSGGRFTILSAAGGSATSCGNLTAPSGDHTTVACRHTGTDLQLLVDGHLAASEPDDDPAGAAPTGLGNPHDHVPTVVWTTVIDDPQLAVWARAAHTDRTWDWDHLVTVLTDHSGDVDG